MSIYKRIENAFEKASGGMARVFSNVLMFLAAAILIICWFWVHDWQQMTLTDSIRDIILAITFLSFFIIQRSFSHFSQALHLKLNELVAAHENARNLIIKAEEKTDEELKELAKEHDRIIEEEVKDKTKD
jgi:low affinity Fe/Cu permease